MSRKHLSLALVQEARICLLAGSIIKDSADPTDALLVLLSGPLSMMHNALFEPAEFSKRIKEQFGWDIPSDALEYFIPRLKKLGWLQSRSEFPARGPYYVNLPDPEVETREAVDTKSAVTEIGTALQAFASEVSPINVLPDDPLEAGALLLRYVVDSSSPAEVANDKPQNDEEYLCARFTKYITRKNLPLKDTLASLSAVGFLFRVAEEIGSPTRTRKIDLKVVVDGPILLDYLGTAGKIREQFYNDIFDDLRKIGASIVTFDHCVQEARNVLRFVLRANPLDRYGPTGEALRQGRVHENVLQTLLHNFDIAVRNKGIEMLPDTIDYMPSSKKYFDDDRARAVEDMVNWHDGENEDARYADADTTVLIIRRRAFHRTTDLFDSKVVCVTSNPTFAGSTRRHLVETSYYNAGQAPPVVTAKELAAKLWLEVGNKDPSDRLRIPRSQLMLSCDRSLRFNRRVVEKARTELAKVKPDQLAQFELLLQVPRSARAVMDATLNNEQYVSGENVELLLEAAIMAAGEEAAQKERERRLRDQEKFTDKLQVAAKLLESEKSRVQQLMNAGHELQADYEQREARLQGEIRAIAEQEKAHDHEVVSSVAEIATGMFARWRFWIRAMSLLLVIPPIYLAIQAYSSGANGLWAVIVALGTALFAAATAMDRPGAWLSKLLHRRIESSIERRLRDLARGDLAERLRMEWKDGVASWSLTD